MDLIKENSNLTELKQSLEYKIDNFLMYLHISLVKENNLRELVQKSYDDLYRWLYRFVLEKLESFNVNELENHAEIILMRLLKYFELKK